MLPSHLQILSILVSLTLLTAQQWSGTYQITPIGFQPGQTSSSCCLPINQTLSITQANSTTPNKLTFSMVFDNSCNNAQFTGPYSINGTQNTGVVDNMNLISIYFPNNTIFLELVPNCNWLLSNSMTINTTSVQNWTKNSFLSGAYSLQEGYQCCTPSNATTITQNSANTVGISFFFSQSLACKATKQNGSLLQLQENVFGGSFVDLANNLAGFYYPNDTIGIVTLSTSGPGCLLQFGSTPAPKSCSGLFVNLFLMLWSFVYVMLTV